MIPFDFGFAVKDVDRLCNVLMLLIVKKRKFITFETINNFGARDLLQLLVTS